MVRNMASVDFVLQVVNRNERPIFSEIKALNLGVDENQPSGTTLDGGPVQARDPDEGDTISSLMGVMALS